MEKDATVSRDNNSQTDSIPAVWPDAARDGENSCRGQRVVGVLEGEGIGPEIVPAAVRVLQTISDQRNLGLEFRAGGLIGIEAEERLGKPLTKGVADFCAEVSDAGGAILCGPGSGRFVYDLRKHFGLFCKVTPIRPLSALHDAGVTRRDSRENVDIVVVRENTGGIYFGESVRQRTDFGQRVRHSFHYDAVTVRRIIKVAVDLAQQRNRHLTLSIKASGLPAISELWKDVFAEATQGAGLKTQCLEVDNAAYQIVASATQFDVIVAPNLFGDILSDIAALLLGSRGMSYSGNFSAEGVQVFQTAHGAAYDIAGKNVANPVGQVFSAAMMLRCAFQLNDAAQAIESAVESVLRSGVRTADIAGPKSQVVGTREMTEAIIAAIETMNHNAQLESDAAVGA